ncbi:MAG: carbon monoxide dehydrogenase, partial [Betaproteobacteria bacterium RIFCSPLOWO2_12_FULL_62_13b]
RLLTGAGCYASDICLPGQAYAAMVRSPHPHARIRSIDKSAAVKAPGVLAVLTGADVLEDGLKNIPEDPAIVMTGPPDVVLRPRTELFKSTRLPIPSDRTRYVGEVLAMVVAETAEQAKDAAELVEIEYEPLPAASQAVDAIGPEALRLWDEASSNVCLDVEVGDEQAAAEAFKRAAHVARLNTWIHRVTGVPMETRTVAAEFDAATGRYTVHAGTGHGVAIFRQELAHVLDVPPERVRCVVQDTGGNFGTRNFFYPEYALVAWAARRIGRPVKWVCERREAFLSDYQGRDLAVEAELALDAEGRFLAVRGSNLSNVGAHTATYVPLRKGLGLMSGVYNIPAAYFRGRAAVSNTVSTTPYRSAGRPEAMFVIERLIDIAADEFGFDPIELRRRNLVPPEAMPFTNPVGVIYDSGRYEAAMDKALELADWKGFPGRRAESKRRGRLRGIGLANWVEITSGNPHERAEVSVLPEGVVELVIGTMSTGQGHETSFAQLLTEWLGVPFESVRFVAHDTDRVQAGGGSHSGRSMKMATLVVGKATDDIIDRGRKIAAHLFEASEPDIEFSRGVFRIAGTNRELGIFDIARAAATRKDLPDELQGTLAAVSDQVVHVASFPYGAQVCEVEVDPETGVVEILSYAAVDDVGRPVNPLIVDGQTHGGIAQGAGQALLEQCHYDRSSGQLLSGSFMDYAMPRADTFPFFKTAFSEVPAPTNRLGVRSGGEGGTTPALAVVINAIVHACAELGVKHIEMPATPERVWRAIRAARTMD